MSTLDEFAVKIRIVARMRRWNRRRLLRKLERLERIFDTFYWYLPPSAAAMQERIWQLRERLGLSIELKP